MDSELNREGSKEQSQEPEKREHTSHTHSARAEQNSSERQSKNGGE